MCYAQLDFSFFSLVGYNRVFPLSLPLAVFFSKTVLPSLVPALEGNVRARSLVTCQQKLAFSSPSLQHSGLI